MSTIATGVFKKLVVKKQSGLGVPATGGAATGTALRRVTSSLDLNKAFYKSAELRPSAQRSDGRHGIRSVKGAINGELSSGTYQLFMESIFRQVSQTATTSTVATVTATVTTAPQGTFARAAGSYLTDGFMLGDILQCTGWSTGGVPNNNHNFMIIAISALSITVLPLDGVSVGAKASEASVVMTNVGKKTWVPATGQTRDYYTVEHNFSDLSLSEQFTDCVVTDMNIKMPATGMCTATFTMMGLNLTTAGTPYFTSPSGPSNGTVMASANGVAAISGVKVGTITAIDFTSNGNYTVPGGVVGANVDPDVFPGVLDVSGTVTILFDGATYRDMFINETIATLALALTADNTPGSAVICFNMAKVKFNGANKDDGEKGLSLTIPFVALENTTVGAGALGTTISVQDSAFV